MRWMHDSTSNWEETIACREVYKINNILNHFYIFNRVFDLNATRYAIFTGQTRFNDKVGANSFSDCFQNHSWESHAVFICSAIFICTLIDEWAQETTEQPAMPHVHKDHITTTAFSHICGFCVNMCYIFHIFFSHLTYMGTRWHIHFNRSHRIASITKLWHGKMTGMIKFNRSFCTKSMGIFIKSVHILEGIFIYHIQMVFMGKRILSIHDNLAHMNCSTAAFCHIAIIGLAFFR